MNKESMLEQLRDTHKEKSREDLLEMIVDMVIIFKKMNNLSKDAINEKYLLIEKHRFPKEVSMFQEKRKRGIEDYLGKKQEEMLVNVEDITQR